MSKSRTGSTSPVPLRVVSGGAQAAPATGNEFNTAGSDALVSDAPLGGEPSDDELIDAIERGDVRYGGMLYDRLVSTVEGTLFRIMGGRAPEHEDLVQVAFEQIVITLARRRFARACSLRSWAGSVTCRVAYNALRARRVERRVLDRLVHMDDVREAIPAQRDFERQTDARQSLERIRHHLGRMRPQRAEAVLLHDVLGYELSEIATLTGATVAASQSRLVRGRRELHERLARDAAAEVS